MEWLTNEFLFYGGISTAVGAAVIALVHLVLSRFRTLRLNAQLNAEYGEMDE